jgi:hypothetical protein
VVGPLRELFVGPEQPNLARVQNLDRQAALSPATVGDRKLVQRKGSLGAIRKFDEVFCFAFAVDCGAFVVRHHLVDGEGGSVEGDAIAAQ